MPPRAWWRVRPAWRLLAQLAAGHAEREDAAAVGAWLKLAEHAGDPSSDGLDGLLAKEAGAIASGEATTPLGRALAAYLRRADLPASLPSQAFGATRAALRPLTVEELEECASAAAAPALRLARPLLDARTAPPSPDAWSSRVATPPPASCASPPSARCADPNSRPPGPEIAGPRPSSASRAERLDRLAHALAIGLRLSAWVRGAGRAWAAGRLVLPTEELARRGIAVDALDPNVPLDDARATALGELLAVLAGRALLHLEKAWPLALLLDPRAGRALALALRWHTFALVEFGRFPRSAARLARDPQSPGPRPALAARPRIALGLVTRRPPAWVASR